jgi:peptidoglycan/xylan/chitin deacetylase (PgdA/CDA1 family)
MRSLRRLVVYGTVASVVAFAACADPLKNNFPDDGKAGVGGTGATAGISGSGGSQGGASGATAGEGGNESGGKGGAGGKGGKGGTGGDSAAGALPGGASNGGELPGGNGGEGGAAAGDAGGEAGMPASGLPVPPTTGVARPSGAPGNLKVLDWAGFKAALSFTFDDALQSQLDTYPLLNAVGVPMTFYLVCNNDGSKQGWKTVAADGHELGNHTMHHCNANGTGCGWGTFTTLEAELDDCTAHLESVYGVTPYTMASPMGDPGWDAPASTRFLVNRGVYNDPNGVLPNGSANPFELPCHIAEQGETAAGVNGFNAVTDAARSLGSWRIVLNHSLGNNDGYHPVDPKEVVAAMTYAKGLGDVWIGTVVSIAAYWRAQKLVAALTPTTSGSDETWSWSLPDHFPPGQYLRVKVDGGTLTQGTTALEWDRHGYYEVALDVGSVTLSP